LGFALDAAVILYFCTVKMKYIATLFFALTGGFILAQPTLNERDDKGQRHGPWKKDFPEGGTRYEGTFEHGREIGTFTFYYPDGKPAAIKEYGKGPGDCFATMYHVGGKLFAQGSYVDTFKLGQWSYWDVKGNFISLEQYELGLKQGAQYSFYTDSTLAEVTHYQKGTLEGPWTIYFEDGSVRAKGTYKNGALDGVAEYFNPEGDPDSKGKYLNGLKDGWWIFYENKKPIRKVRYHRGNQEEAEEL